MAGQSKHSRAFEITERGKLLEDNLLRARGGAEKAHSVISGVIKSEDTNDKDLLSRLLPMRRANSFAAVGKLNENGTQVETMWVKESTWTGSVKSTLLVRNLGSAGRIYEVTSFEGNGFFETVTEKDGMLIYQKHELPDPE